MNKLFESIYSNEIDNEVEEISKVFRNYTSLKAAGEADEEEYVEVCKTLLDKLKTAARKVAENFVISENKVPEMELLSLQSMYSTIQKAIDRVFSN